MKHRESDNLEDLLPVLGLNGEGLPNRVGDHLVVVPVRQSRKSSPILVVRRLSNISEHGSGGTPVLVRKRLVQGLFELRLLTTRLGSDSANSSRNKSLCLI